MVVVEEGALQREFLQEILNSRNNAVCGDLARRSSLIHFRRKDNLPTATIWWNLEP